VYYVLGAFVTLAGIFLGNALYAAVHERDFRFSVGSRKGWAYAEERRLRDDRQFLHAGRSQYVSLGSFMGVHCTSTRVPSGST
jgi:hypothetical protein